MPVGIGNHARRYRQPYSEVSTTILVGMGNDVGRTMADAISGGLKTSIIMAFFALLIFSGRQMIDDAFRMRYDGPMEAMLGWFTKMMEITIFINASKNAPLRVCLKWPITSTMDW